MSQQIGRYRVTGELGRGGMGVVFAVEPMGPPAPPGPLALKLLLSATPQQVDRFRREADALRFLSRHPGVVTLRDLGLHEGQPYLVMDRVEGSSLERRLRQGDLPRAAALGLLVDVARALHFAHEAGFVHRDVKPGNVLLTDEGRALVADFGVVRDQTAEALTRTGELVGTLAYMAPEQADGRRDEIDRRTDVYALGAMLYEVLTGRRPFEGAQTEILYALFEEPPRPPRELAPDVDPAVEAVCLRALAKDPAGRQPTAEDFARALEAALGAGRAAPDGASTGAGDGGPPAPRRAPGRGVVAVVALLAASGGAAAGALASGAGGEPERTAGVDDARAAAPPGLAELIGAAAAAGVAPPPALVEVAARELEPGRARALEATAALAAGRHEEALRLAGGLSPALAARVRFEVAVRADPGRAAPAAALVHALPGEVAPPVARLARRARALAEAGDHDGAAEAAARGCEPDAGDLAPRLELGAWAASVLTPLDARQARRLAAAALSLAQEVGARPAPELEELARAGELLDDARALDPRADTVTARARLEARAGGDAELLRATAPWRRLVARAAWPHVEALLAAPLDGAPAGWDAARPATLPRAFRAFQHLAETDLTELGERPRTEALWAAWVERHPELAAGWLARARARAVTDPRRGQHLGLAGAALEDTPEIQFWRASHARMAGLHEVARAASARTAEGHPWHELGGILANLAGDEAERARALLLLGARAGELDRGGSHEALGIPRVWLTIAAALEACGEAERAADAAQRARARAEARAQ